MGDIHLAPLMALMPLVGSVRLYHAFAFAFAIAIAIHRRRRLRPNHCRSGKIKSPPCSTPGQRMSLSNRMSSSARAFKRSVDNGKKFLSQVLRRHIDHKRTVLDVPVTTIMFAEDAIVKYRSLCLRLLHPFEEDNRKVHFELTDMSSGVCNPG